MKPLPDEHPWHQTRDVPTVHYQLRPATRGRARRALDEGQDLANLLASDGSALALLLEPGRRASAGREQAQSGGDA